ncbi:MAG: FprA family A-type flavoprotein [Eubacteriales bacterium]|nr:FprA family A-type flavoprotein [Eubacteriales bacterium]
MAFRKVTDSILYVGVNDHEVDLFEGQYVVPNGMAYNSYVILDDKIAVMDTVDIHFAQEWLNNIAEALDGKKPTYLVVQHMEPDHSASIAEFLKVYPDAIVVGNAKTFVMMQQFFGADVAPNREVVANKGTLELGSHTLTFVFAPMVHWPEVMVTYDSADKVLFSADGFGKFGALDVEEDWDCEARRYYIGIVGKYGAQVQALLKVAATLDIQTICPLHGPVLTENLGHYIEKYDIWSSYKVESEGVMIAYASVYGNTKKAAEKLAETLKAKGCPKVVLRDLARSDMAENIEDAFRYGKLVLASITYNGDVFPFMHAFLHGLTERSYQNRTLGVIENGTWAPTAGRIIKSAFEKSKNITWLDTTVTIKSAMNAANDAQIEAMADELMKG